MRVDKIIFHRNIVDPKSYNGSMASATSGHVEKTVEDYDLYWLGDTFYVVRESKYVAVVMPQATGYLRGPEGAKKAAELAKRFPRPAPLDASESSSTS